MTAEALVARIRRLDEQTATARAKLGNIADARAAAIDKLAELVGADQAAQMLGVTRSAIWKAIYRSRAL